MCFADGPTASLFTDTPGAYTSRIFVNSVFFGKNVCNFILFYYFYTDLITTKIHQTLEPYENLKRKKKKSDVSLSKTLNPEISHF